MAYHGSCNTTIDTNRPVLAKIRVLKRLLSLCREHAEGSCSDEKNLFHL